MAAKKEKIDVQGYLAKHRVAALFEVKTDRTKGYINIYILFFKDLMAKVIKQLPNDPVEFIIRKLQTLHQKQKKVSVSSYFFLLVKWFVVCRHLFLLLPSALSRQCHLGARFKSPEQPSPLNHLNVCNEQILGSMLSIKITLYTVREAFCPYSLIWFASWEIF